MGLIPGLVLRSPLSWLHGGETETRCPPARCCLWASHLYCCFTSHSFEAPWLLPPPLPGFLTLQLHSHTWRLGIQDRLLECWQAPALSSPVCPSAHLTLHLKGLSAIAPDMSSARLLPPPSLIPERQLQPLAAQADTWGVASNSSFSLAQSSSPSGSPATQLENRFEI